MFPLHVRCHKKRRYCNLVQLSKSLFNEIMLEQSTQMKLTISKETNIWLISTSFILNIIRLWSSSYAFVKRDTIFLFYKNTPLPEQPWLPPCMVLAFHNCRADTLFHWLFRNMKISPIGCAEKYQSLQKRSVSCSHCYSMYRPWRKATVLKVEQQWTSAYFSTTTTTKKLKNIFKEEVKPNVMIHFSWQSLP